jgi:imidazolonepropionase-like amidohydrolase
MKLVNAIVAIMLTSCTMGPTQYDLAIRNAQVFDVYTGKLLPHQTILIAKGKIGIVTGEPIQFDAVKIIDAKGKLVTPGLIDTHIHPTDVFGDYAAAPAVIPADSAGYYRKRLSNVYLPYGVTVAMSMGHPEAWSKTILDWSAKPSPNFLDVYTTGAAIISKEDRKPYVGHITVESPGAASRKVIDYYRMGMRHIKVYWRLRSPEMAAALKTADSLHMHVYGHIDQNIMTIDSTLKLGLRNYEHVVSLGNSLMYNTADWLQMHGSFAGKYGGKNLSYQSRYLELFRYAHDNRPSKVDSLIDQMAAHKATLSTTFHLVAEPYGLTYFAGSQDTSLTAAEIDRCRENFKIMMQYARMLHRKGVPLRIGTDCVDGGKAMLSELLLMQQNNFSVAEIFQIATINGAKALGMDDRYGAVSPGRQADLLIWDKSPFEDGRNFLSRKRVIKDGVEVY